MPSNCLLNDTDIEQRNTNRKKFYILVMDSVVWNNVFGCKNLNDIFTFILRKYRESASFLKCKPLNVKSF